MDLGYTLYVSRLRLNLEYNLHIWVTALPPTFHLRHAIQIKAITDNPALTAKLSSFARPGFHLRQFSEDQLVVRYECIHLLTNFNSPGHLNYVDLSLLECPDYGKTSRGFPSTRISTRLSFVLTGSNSIDCWSPQCVNSWDFTPHGVTYAKKKTNHCQTTKYLKGF